MVLRDAWAKYAKFGESQTVIAERFFLVIRGVTCRFPVYGRIFPVCCGLFPVIHICSFVHHSSMFRVVDMQLLRMNGFFPLCYGFLPVCHGLNRAVVFKTLGMSLLMETETTQTRLRLKIAATSHFSHRVKLQERWAKCLCFFVLDLGPNLSPCCNALCHNYFTKVSKSPLLMAQ